MLETTNVLQMMGDFRRYIQSINNKTPDDNGNININEYDISVKDERLNITKIGGNE